MNLLQSAYDKLGLPQTASMKEVEDRYFLLMRREKAKQNKSSQALSPEESSTNFQEVTQAYQIIKQHVFSQKLESDYPEEQKKSPARKKIDHVWLYYKWHMIAACLVLVIVGVIFQGIVEKQREKAIEAAKPPIDAQITLFGEYILSSMDPDFTPSENKAIAVMPNWKRIEMNFVYAPLSPKDSFDIGLQQKSVVMIATEKNDMYIMDKGNFDKYAGLSLFYPLSTYEAELKKSLGENRLYYAQTESSSTPILFGIDITSLAWFDEIIMSNQPQILTIRADTVNLEKTIALIRASAQQSLTSSDE